MDFKVEQLSQVRRRLEVTVPAAEVDKLLNKLYKAVQKGARLKGFRPGKAPRAVLEKYYAGQVGYEAADNLVRDHYPEAVKESDLEPVAAPQFDFEPPAAGQDWTFTAELDVRPEFELDPESYKGLEIKEPRQEVTEEEIDQRLETLRDRQAVLVPVEQERPAGAGDVVVINYQSFDGDQEVEGGAADNVEVELGKGQTQEEIEVALVKSKPGDIVETTVSYGDDAPNEQLRGKDIRFKLFVKELKQKQLPELDDDFARAVSPEFDTLAALRQRMHDDLEKMYAQQAEQEVRKQILDQIRDLGEFELPESLVEQELDQMVEGFKQRLKQSGMDPETAGLDESRVRDDFRQEAEKKVRAGIVLGKIADLEDIEATDADIDAEFEKLAERTGQPVEALKQIYNKNNMMSDMAATVMEEKTLQAIRAGANIESIDPAELAAKNEPGAES